MESFFKLNLEPRSKTGNAAARKLRRDGKIPVNYYYGGEENQNMSIDRKILHKAVQSGQQVFELELDGNTIYVTVKEAQYHPVTEEIIHLDLLRVRRDVKMKFSIPLNLVGDSVGAIEGGIVSQSANVIDIECLPTDVPDSIDVDITSLELNGTVFANDIVLPDDTELLSPEDTTIAVCAPPKAEVEVEVPDEEGDEDGEDASEAQGETEDKKTEDGGDKEQKPEDESSE